MCPTQAKQQLEKHTLGTHPDLTSSLFACRGLSQGLPWSSSQQIPPRFRCKMLLVQCMQALHLGNTSAMTSSAAICYRVQTPAYGKAAVCASPGAPHKSDQPNAMPVTPEVCASQPLAVQAQRQRGVCLKAALVKLVKHHCAHTSQLWVLQQPKCRIVCVIRVVPLSPKTQGL